MLGARSAIAWIIDRYQIRTDKPSRITDDPNTYSDDPRYIIDLLRRIVTVSLETMRIVDELPSLPAWISSPSDLVVPSPYPPSEVIEFKESAVNAVRVYELAKELELEPREVISALADGVDPPRSASSLLAPEDVRRLRSMTGGKGLSDRVEAAVSTSSRGRGCACCQRSGVELVKPKLPDDLPAPRDMYVCRSCVHHSLPRDSREVQRNRSHALLYANDAAKDVEVMRSSFEEENKKLKAELEDRPVIERNLDQDELDRGRDQVRSALSSRDLAFHDLLGIKLLHRKRAGDVCTCGLQRCKTAQFFTEQVGATLDKWESQQESLFRQGMAHYLPDNHPTVLGGRS